MLALPAVDLLTAYRTMLTIRRFEERCLDLRGQDLIAGSIHLCAGQEAIPVGTIAALGSRARVCATYRGHGWAIACGVPLVALLAEICGRATGTNGGRGGSAYLTAPEFGLIGENSIVGAGVPIAVGLALAAQHEGSDRVAVASFGDGATSEGAVHEAIVMAASRNLPVVFVCENNGWSEMTSIASICRVDRLAERAAGYGIHGVTVDGNDAEAVSLAVAEAAERGGRGEGPTFIEARTVRLWAHYNADVEHYRSAADKEAATAADPLPRLVRRLLDGGAPESDLERIDGEVANEIDEATEAALAAPAPDPTTARDHVYASRPVSAAQDEPNQVATTMSYAQAVGLALRHELTERSEVIVYGEDIAAPGGVFGVTRRLQRDFGPERVFDTPIAESAILGSALGAALEGMRPIVEIMWADFLLVALDQLINQAANVSYLSGGSQSAPLVVRCQQGVTPGSCAQHSQSLEALLCHIPGLRVGMPANPQDAYAMLRAAVADPDPCILIECRALYADEAPVVVDAPVEGVGGARLRRDGSDVGIVTWGRMANRALAAAAELASDGIDVAVLDLRWLNPLDRVAIDEIAQKTSRVLVVHEANITAGFGAEVVASIVAGSFSYLDAPVVRVGTPDVRIPAAPVLQDALVPGVETIVQAARDLMGA